MAPMLIGSPPHQHEEGRVGSWVRLSRILATYKHLFRSSPQRLTDARDGRGDLRIDEQRAGDGDAATALDPRIGHDLDVLALVG
jgi:hypothetical protein